MKRKLKMIVLLFIMFLIPKQVFAAGGYSVSPSNISLNPGGSATVTIYTDNAVGLLNIESTSPDVAAVSMESTFVQQPGQSVAFTVTANSAGTATINVIATQNFATMDEEILAGQVRSIVVNVTNPAPPEPQQPSQPVQPQQPQTPTNQEPAKSSNTNIRNITVSGKEPTKVDDNNYTLTVSNSVTIVTISADKDDEKTTIEGLGDHELKIGDNEIILKAIAESGAERTIKIVVTRRKGYAISDLDDIIKDKPDEVVDIIIEEGEVLDDDAISKLKSSGILANFNYFDVEEKLKYSWQIDGFKLRNTKGFNPKVEIVKDYLEAIDIASNYAKGVNIKLSNQISNPKGMKLKVFIGDQYKTGDFVNIYTLKNDKLYLKDSKVKVDAGYITFNIASNIDYFVTQSELNKKSNDSNSYLIASVFLTVIIIIMLIIVIIMSKRLNKLTHKKVEGEEVVVAPNRKIIASNEEVNKTIGESTEKQPSIENEENKVAGETKEEPTIEDNSKKSEDILDEYLSRKK